MIQSEGKTAGGVLLTESAKEKPVIGEVSRTLSGASAKTISWYYESMRKFKYGNLIIR